MIHRINIIVKGRVQGVWFRASAQKEAIALGINGQVSNRPDGTVFIDAEGSVEQLDTFRKWCSIGPQFAKVQEVEVLKVPDLRNYHSFEIVR